MALANIGVQERRKRLTFGLLLLAFSVLAAAVLIGSGAPRVWRVLLMLPLWASALGFFQASDRT